MSKAVEDAIAARETAKRPAPPEPTPEPVKRTRKHKDDDAAVAEALAQLEAQHNALTVSEGEDPGFTTLVERESADDRTFEEPA